MQLVIQQIRNSQLLLTLIGAGLLFFCSQVSIPLQPVPITLQTVAVLVIGLTFPRTQALRSVISYLTLGAFGLPVFSNFSGGLAILIGPRGGYLFGFLAAVWVMSSLRQKITYLGTKEAVLIALAGSSVVFLIGMPWLSTFIGWDFAVSAGLLPFIIPGIVKSVLVACIVRYVNKSM